MKTYIIGYGSLLNRSSLNRTLPQVKKIEPIYLNQYCRYWHANENITPTFSSTFLGVSKSEHSRINCIIFEIEESFLPVIDKREFLYHREQVNLNDIEFTSNQFEINTDDNIWIYITDKPSLASKEFPIIQSYVDVCLSGAMQLEEEFNLENFAIDFIKTTKQWSPSWVNDRIFPRAPHIHQPDAYRIDIMLSENINQYFSKIIIE
ncbi:MAG: gamma-glutamylcyclotransferase [Helicobacteraceae bacterium]|nr:gamma-glutamylcyclotransferase [Candidatus Sulfurimonas ponti]MBL6972960.1 gamma-glutamylcyclotransferase [Sulfurimonas sp.]